MSKGIGAIEQFILDALERDDLWPIPALASRYADQAGVEDTRHLRSSFRRAANSLERKGEVGLGDYLLPTRWLEGDRPYAWRWTLCVGSPGFEFNEEGHAAAMLTVTIFRPEPV